MTDKLNVITGASGLVGSHIAEKLVERGERVRAFVRPSSDTRFLKQLGVDFAVGDMQDVSSIRKAVSGATIVYHCAARVGDWGPWHEYETQTINGTRNLVEACKAEPVGRILHVSSVSVYGHHKNPKGLLDETTPTGQNLWLWDNYARAKALAELEVRKYSDHTIVRPSWVYGPRDRLAFPRVVKAMRIGAAPLLGTAENLLNIVYAGDVANGAILAANSPKAVGEAYNLCSNGGITQKKMADTVCDALGVPRLKKRIPLFLAYQFAFFSELFGKLIGKKDPPRVTRRAVYMLSRPIEFTPEKARRELGWVEEIGIEEGVRRSLEWLFQHEAEQQQKSAATA